MTKGCYTCRRRRIVCDNEFPTCRKCRNAGKECLGYQKPLVWVKGGVASRGKMMGLSFDDVVDPEPSRPANSTLCVMSGPARPPLEDEHGSGTWTSGTQEEHQYFLSEVSENPQYPSEVGDGTLVQLQNAHTRSPMYSLVDPLFQDLNKMGRFYLDIFSRDCVKWFALYDAVQNPYRELLPYINDSPLLADSLTAIGAIEFAYMSNGDCQPVSHAVGDETTKADLALVKPRDSQAYEHFLQLKQRALRRLSTEVSHPLTHIDNRTVAAIFVLILLNMIESGNTAWMYHLEGAKNILRGRLADMNSLSASGGINSFIVNSCLITEIMGSTLARPGVLSKPFYSPGMGAPVLKRLERTAWVGCPAYLLDVIFFVHAQRYSEPGQTAEYSLSFLSPSGETTRAESPLAILRHIEAFDTYAWAEEMQSYLALPDLSQRIAMAQAYKAAVYLYARRVVSKMSAFSSDCCALAMGPAGPLQDRKIVADELIRNLSLVSPNDEHFKCLIWPTFIAGAESTSPEQRVTTLQLLGLLWNGFYSFNLQNAASVLKVMWEKQDERQRNRQADSGFSLDLENTDDEEGFDWIRELDQSSTDWLFI